jgi:murein DD-endopeptidase MepM/ murein hydrolase activator NlpD
MQHTKSSLIHPFPILLNPINPLNRFSHLTEKDSNHLRIISKTQRPFKPKLPLYTKLNPQNFSIQPILAQDLVIKKGDSIHSLFQRAKISTKDYQQFIKLPQSKLLQKHIRPQQKIEFRTDKIHQLISLHYILDPSRFLLVTRKNDHLIASIETKPLKTKWISASGQIHSSLYRAIKKANLPREFTSKLIAIFDNRIDFSRQIRSNDRFKIVYKAYVDKKGHIIKSADIIAAKFVNRQKLYYAIRYQDSDGHTAYYTPQGKNLRTTFLRYPVKFSHISSRFNTSRRHPILHIVRPHTGVDLAAPYGTPIKATGNGRIVFRGRKGGYGKLIIIRHDRHHSTRYGHLSRFSNHFHKNSYIRQGQIIGYVGQTGFATGPHLHYEFRINGIAHDPLKVNLPAGRSIPKKEQRKSQHYANKLMKQLDQA